MKYLALVLLFFPPHVASLPAIPATVWSVYGPVAVVRQHPTDCGEEHAIGCYHMLSRTIVVDDSLALPMAWRVFEHEHYHVMARDQNAGFSSQMDEQVAANVYANYRVAQMQAGAP